MKLSNRIDKPHTPHILKIIYIIQVIKNYLTRVSLVKYLFKKERPVDGAYDIVFFGESARSVIKEGRSSERISDSVIEDLESIGMSCISIDNPFSEAKSGDCWGNVFTINKRYLIAALIQRIIRVRSKIFIYRSIIRVTKPRYVFTMNVRPDICVACKLEGVICIEVLHGMGYTFIPWGWDKMSAKYLPDYILTLDRISLQTFSALKSKGIKVRQVEHPFNKRFLHPRYKNNFQESYEESIGDIRGRKVVLLSLSWGYDGDLPDFSGILTNGMFYEAFSDIFALTKEDIYWGVRFHQLQVSQPKKYKKHFRHIIELCEQFSNVTFRWFTYNPLPIVLRSCSANVTMMSTSCCDAAQFGVPSLALCPNLRNGKKYSNMYDDLVSAGLVTKLEFSVGGVLRWVRHAQKQEAYKLENDLGWQSFVDEIFGT